MSKAAGYKLSFTVHTTSLTFFGLKQSHDNAFWRKLLEKQLFKLPTESFGDEEIEEAIDLANDHESEAGHYLPDLQEWMENEDPEPYTRFMWEAVAYLNIYGVTADIILGECIHAGNQSSEQIKASNAAHFTELSQRLHLDCGDLDQIAKVEGVPISEIDMRKSLSKAGCSVLLASRLEDTDYYETEIITSDQDISSVAIDWNLRALTLPNGESLVVGSVPHGFNLCDQRVGLEQVINRTGGHDDTVIIYD